MNETSGDDARVERFNALGAAAFDQLGEVSGADDALLDRLVDRAMQAPPAPAGPTSTTASSGIATKIVVALVVGGGVVAGALLMRQPADSPSATVPPTEIAEHAAEPDPAPEPPAPPAALPSTAGEEQHAPEPGPAPALADAPSKPAKPPVQKAPTPDDPAALLLAANRARRADQPDQARALYRQLAERFPGSREHRISHVALGDLELETYRRPAPALEQYEAYLRAKPKGNLAEEALYGKARALDQLGRGEQAAQAWSGLLQRFPDSLHAPAAKRRLEE